MSTRTSDRFTIVAGLLVMPLGVVTAVFVALDFVSLRMMPLFVALPPSLSRLTIETAGLFIGYGRYALLALALFLAVVWYGARRATITTSTKGNR